MRSAMWKPANRDWDPSSPRAERVSSFRGEAGRTPGDSTVAYAVIEARWSEARAERFALAYCGEESLRDLFAARSIISLGFESREAAEASIEGNLCHVVSSAHLAAMMAFDVPEMRV